MFSIPSIKHGISEYNAIERSSIEIGIIKKAPLICLRRHNKIKILVKEDEYTLPVSSQKCRSREYSIGSEIAVRYDSELDKVFNANFNPSFFLLLMTLPLFLSIYLIYRAINS